jgi:anion-transporting  ArsA/GET3 family ATPase
MGCHRGMILDALVRSSRTIICAGPGGVGKTTTAAAIALHGARLGMRSCVVTIDPAKRLADALGLASLSNEPHRVDGDWTGELWALMLDTKGTFDQVVRRHAASPEQAETILSNRLYLNISGALGGTQEYMAMEKLYELHHSPSQQFDLVVVDTPPTRRALDFLDAPARLLRFLNNRVFRLLMLPTRASVRAVSVSTRLFLRTISRVVGGAVVEDAVAFFAAFEGMEQGFRERAARVEALLSDPGTAFVVVASARRDAVEEAVYFASRVSASRAPVAALVVNRMFPTFGSSPAGAPEAAAMISHTADGAVRAMLNNLRDLDEVARREELYVEQLRSRLPGVPVVRVPILAGDVHDVEGLSEIGRLLFASTS